MYNTNGTIHDVHDARINVGTPWQVGLG